MHHTPGMPGMQHLHGMHDMASMLPPLSWHALLHTWQLRPVWTLLALLALAAYVWGLSVCRRHQVRSVQPARVACFVAGVVLLLLTLSSAIDVYAMALFWDHMIEHLMLIMVVPTLLVLGHPLTLLRAAAGARGRGETVDRVLQSPPVALLTYPGVGVALYSAVIVGTHLTSFMDAMATRPWLMDLEQVLYLVSGYLFLLPLVGNEPIRWKLPNLGRIAIVLLAMTPDTVVGIVLMQTNHDMFPVMEGAHPSWAPPPLVDLQIAGGLMWAGGDGLMMLIGIGVTIALITDPSQESVLGKRLEGVRRATLTGHVSRGDTAPTPFDESLSVDDDDAMLDAYNRMLGRLDREETS
jgi:putative membrane protein